MQRCAFNRNHAPQLADSSRETPFFSNLLKKGNGIETENARDAVPLANEHLPSNLVLGETIILVALREMENVNQIPKNHTLTFSESGITVIYGGNGSGKSGYARVMKRACRARDQSEPIHPNANDPAASLKVPSAKFDIKVAGTLEEIAWSRDSKPPDCLSTVSVFDSRCARSYITAEQDVAYLPYGLDIVESLANQVLPKLSEILEAEIAGINVDRLPFGHLIGKTLVGEAIQNLSIKSDADAITSLGTLTDDDTGRIADLENALKEANPLAKAAEFRRSAIRLKTYGDRLAKPLAWVSTEAAEKLKGIAAEWTVAEDAETKAADSLRAGEELLRGTGDQAWMLLFEAARRYSTEAAYPGEEFPPTEESRACPLCQEELSESRDSTLQAI